MIQVNELLKTLQDEFEQASYGEHPAELYEPIGYIMSLGGKRFRPLLTLLATCLFTDDWRKALKPAMAVEVFHNFTLMHDDIMDKAPLRRGQPTVHHKWNDNTAILSGDVMLIKAYGLLIHVPDKSLRNVIERFNTTAAEVCEGQQLDMNFERRWDVTEAEYIEMIRLKTSVVLGMSLELGGIIGEADEATKKLMYRAGESMGLGFQLKDDLLDVYGDPKTFGKQVGGDIIANKKTFLLIEALERAEGSVREELDSWLAAEDFDKEAKVAAVRGIYDRLGIRAITEQKIQTYFQEGFRALEQVSADETRKKPLLDFVHRLVEREQ